MEKMTLFLGAELYRLRRQKSTWIILLCALAYILFNASTLGMVSGNAPWLADMVERLLSSPAASMYGENYISELRSLFETQIGTLAEYMAVCIRGDHLLFMLIFFNCFIMPFYRFELAASLMPGLKERDVFTAHALVLLVYAVLLVVSAEVGIGMLSLAYFRGTPMGNVGALTVHLLLNILALWALAVLILFLVSRSRNKRRTMLLSVLYVLFASAFLYMIIDMPLALISKDLMFEKFTPVMSLVYLEFGSLTTGLSCGIGSLVYLVICFAAVFTSRKKYDMV